MNIFLKSLTIMLSFIAGLPAMEKENTGLGNCHPDIHPIFLTEVLTDNYIAQDFTNFIENARSLKTVCKQWSNIIDKNFMHTAMVLGCQQICPEFLNGKLIYRPTEGSDEGMIEHKVSGLWNPLEGKFNLSQCGDTTEYISISTGYRKVKKAENAYKVEIWFTPKVLVEKELNTTAGQFKGIFPSKWNDGASVGMFWTWGEWDNLGWYDYLTSESRDNLSKINLFKNWNKCMANLRQGSAHSQRLYADNVHSSLRGACSRFHVSFVS